jgi:predicted AAA+ superfamily ATPase
MVNFTKVANDAQVARTTVHEYFGILQDTLLVHELPAWRRSVKRKPIATSKYYFFDIGVASALQGRVPAPGTREWGEALETLLLNELVAWRDYESGDALSYRRSTSGFEVDFLIGDHTAVEVKSSAHVSPGDLRSLRALGEERLVKRLICVSLEPAPRRVGNVQVLPLTTFLERLWGGEYR